MKSDILEISVQFQHQTESAVDALASGNVVDMMAAHEAPPETVDHPEHYGGADNPYEAIKVIDAWGLGFCLGNTVKYISRAGRKDVSKKTEDLRKARWYLDREIQNLESQNA